MQQQDTSLTVVNIMDTNAALKRIKAMGTTITYMSVKSPGLVETVSYSDVAFHVSNSPALQPDGIDIKTICRFEEKKVYHPIYWTSCKEKLVCNSSHRAKILACTDVNDGGDNIRQSMRSLFRKENIEHTLVKDSEGLYNTITELHAEKGYRPRQTFQRIRGSFESGEINRLKWVPGYSNPADGLTKGNSLAHEMISCKLELCTLSISRHNRYELNGHTWKYENQYEIDSTGEWCGIYASRRRQIQAKWCTRTPHTVRNYTRNRPA